MVELETEDNLDETGENSTDAAAEELEVWMPQLFRLLLAVPACVLLFFWSIGQYYRDSHHFTALCFYIPSLLVAVLWLILTFFYWRSGQWKITLACFVLSLPALGYVAFVENSWFRSLPLQPEEPVRIVHWNVADGAMGWEAIEDVLVEQQADIYVLSEIPSVNASRSIIAKLGEDYNGICFASMAVIARGEIENTRWHRLTWSEEVFEFTWNWDSKPLRVFAVDYAADPGVPRDPLLQRLRGFINGAEPDLVVGDFNAPRRSLAIHPLPTGYQHAYDSSGRGLGYTWPVPVPMLAIDQTIHGPAIQPARYQLITSRLSDHRMQVFDFKLRDD